jgi:hypothetical protein
LGFEWQPGTLKLPVSSINVSGESTPVCIIVVAVINLNVLPGV